VNPNPDTPDLPRAPILLVHGMGGFDQIRLELLHKYPLQIDYFKGIAECLRRAGAGPIFAAALPPAGGIESRANTLGEFIDEKLGTKRFHIIAHSMGGLDARHYIAHLGGAERVISLTTLGTPHRGSPLADLSAEVIFGYFADAIEKLGLDQLVRRLQTSLGAHRDLRPEDCMAFNEQTPDHPEVAYYSWAGAPEAEWVPFFLKIPHMMLLKGDGGGANDGLVTVESARWSGWKGTIPIDHVSMVGWQFTTAIRDHFDVQAFYCSLLPDLAAAEAR
jgi:triacylglycerol lipase